MLSLRVSRDKRGYDHIYLLLETRRKGRTVTRLLYGGRWPSPMKIGQQPLDEATRKTLEQAYPEVTFDWAALTRTMQQALATPRAPMTPETRRRRAGEDRRSASPAPGGGGGQSQGQGGQGGRPPQGPGRVPPPSRPQQMPGRQRQPYAGGFGDQGEQRRPADARGPREFHASHESPHEHEDRPGLDDEIRQRALDDTADLPFDSMDAAEHDSDADVVDLPGRPYDEPILEEGLETEPRRGGALADADVPMGPEEIEPVEERTFVVSIDDDDTDSGDRVLAADDLAEDQGEFGPAKFERPELPGPGFTRDEFPVAASEPPDAEQGSVQGGSDRPPDGFAAGPGPGSASAGDPSAQPRRRRRRRRGGRRTHGGPPAASQQGDGPPSEAGGGPDQADGDSDGHDDDSDV